MRNRLVVAILALQQRRQECLVIGLRIGIGQGFSQCCCCLCNRAALHLQARQHHGEAGMIRFAVQPVLQHALGLRAALAFEQQRDQRLPRRIMARIQAQCRLVPGQCIGDASLLH